ncbi:MAG: SLBB domain-containing protein [Planctomycetaceae bacterium]
MKTSTSAIRCVSATVMFALSLLCGCQADNHHYASSMPRRLMLQRQANPQEIDISKFAWANGGSETIGPGDILDISIAASLTKDDQVTIPVRIADDGTATIPNLGTISLAGYEPQAAEALIRMETINRNVYHNPSVTVAFAHKRTNSVRVLGAVKVPGTYPLPPGSSDIVSAIAAAGGLAEDAGENVEIRNPVQQKQNVPRTSVAGGAHSVPFTTVSDSVEISGGMTSQTINLISASSATEGGNHYRVMDGGVVMVEKRDPAPIQVLGLVNKPDTYDFPLGKDLTVLGAISMAGGLKNQLANKIYVIRQMPNRTEPDVIQVSLRRAKHNGSENIRLGPGDVVSVEQTPSTVMLEVLQLIRIGVNGTAGLF